MAWRTHGWVAASEVLQLPTPGVSADAILERLHQSGVFEWAGGVGAEVSGVVGETESCLCDGFGRENAKSLRVGNYT
ncbi:hypothetical protein [Nostoc sp. KVJ20]|uniref:hypothetical protein n=1 Tax=Nostoc sp. KVJ20 TaxID=457944 RepID=UPI00159F2784|nr:hypothetical protein [Nostoc sp. KVJ20]